MVRECSKMGVIYTDRKGGNKDDVVIVKKVWQGF